MALGERGVDRDCAPHLLRQESVVCGNLETVGVPSVEVVFAPGDFAFVFLDYSWISHIPGASPDPVHREPLATCSGAIVGRRGTFVFAGVDSVPANLVADQRCVLPCFCLPGLPIGEDVSALFEQ